MAGVIDFGFNFGKKPKKKQTPMSNSAIAKVVGGASKTGISRVQGNQGVTQGNEGWKSQYIPQNPNDIMKNSIINSLTKKTDFTMPEIKHSLLTNKGFNEALGVVGARNNAKLDMQNRRVLGGVFGSLLSNDAQKYATDKRYDIGVMNDKTTRRGQDLNLQTQEERIKELANYHKTLGEYYKGQNEIGHERNQITMSSIDAKSHPKPLHPLDAQLKREKLLMNGVNDNTEKILGKEFNELDEDTQKDVVHRYITQGLAPIRYEPVEKEGTFWNTTTYKPIYAEPNTTVQESQTPKQQTQANSKKATITGKALDGVSKALNIDRSQLKISDDGSAVVFPDGSVMTADELAKIAGA